MKPGPLPAVGLWAVVLPVVLAMVVLPGVLPEVLSGVLLQVPPGMLPEVLPGVLPWVLPVVLTWVLALALLPEVLHVVPPELLPWEMPFCPAGEIHPAEQQKQCCKLAPPTQRTGKAPKNTAKTPHTMPCHPTPVGIAQDVFLTVLVV